MAGLPGWVTPHTIRKTVASHLPTLEDTRQMLGHSNAAITARNYRELLDKLPDVTRPERRRSGSWRAMLFGGTANY